MTDYRVLITGSRHWDSYIGMTRAFELFQSSVDVAFEEMIIIHGGARGADTIAGDIAKRFGCQVEVHPADWVAHGKAAGPIRNQQMVDLGADICLAFPLGESRGTRHCMKAAEKAGIKVINYGD